MAARVSTGQTAGLPNNVQESRAVDAVDLAVPARPAVFLDWAYSAGLMRLSGIGIQFRHREFQTWLVR